jgi:hypothetical protein
VSRFFPGIPRESILSVTDRKVDEGTPETPAEDNSQVQAQPQQLPTRTYAQPTSTGWSARDPRVRRAK